MFSKNGSIPKPETDGTEGWIEVPDQPECPAGKEVVWWYPPGWVIRDPKPWADCSWNQSEQRWVEFSLPQVVQTEEIAQEQIQSIDSEQIQSFDSIQIFALSSHDIRFL
jgi:hypothetical protein